MTLFRDDKPRDNFSYNVRGGEREEGRGGREEETNKRKNVRERKRKDGGGKVRAERYE